jgi:hypothetical protein
MVIFAGAERLNYRLADVYTFDFSTYRWTLLKCGGESPSGRFAHTMSMSIDGKKAFVFGGTDRNQCFNDLYELDLEEKSWRRIPISGNALPKSRYFHSSCLDHDTGSLYIWGGKGSTSQQMRYADLFRIQVIKGTEERPGSHCTMVKDLTELYISEKFTDKSFQCSDGIVLSAHYLILQARIGSMVKSLEVLAMQMNSSVIHMFLYFIYSDHLIISRNIPSLDYLDLMYLGARLKLPRLVNLCLKRVQESISKNLALELLERLKDFKYKSLLPDLEKFLLLYTNLHFGRGRSLDVEDITNIVIPKSTLSHDLLKLRKPLNFVSGLNVNSRSPSPSSRGFESKIPPCDITFRFGLRELTAIEIRAHSIILASRSKFFASLSFRELMSEGQSKICTFPSLDDHEGFISPSAFSFLLDYLYGGRAVLSNLSEDFAREFLRSDASNYFVLSSDELTRACISVLDHTSQPSRRLSSLSPFRRISSSTADQSGTCQIM